ncbi:MAG: serine hydrolase [Flavobacteriales bacterium]|nr:serine hydrolase [Flavobacteriales bacterium]
MERRFRTRPSPACTGPAPEAFPRYYCATYPDGGMVTSSSDFGKYMAELVRGYRGQGTILSKASYAEYFREQLADSNFVDRATGMFTDEHNIGITIGFSSEGYFGHTGGDPGLFSMFFVERSTGLGRYMIVNTDMEGWEHHKQVWDMLGRYAGKLSHSTPPW